jgi:ankyrin repeat protein
MPPTGVGVALAPLPENEWEFPELSLELFFLHSCEHGILSLAWLMRWRGVSRGWRENIHKSLPLLRGVSFHVGVTGEDVLRALGLVAGGSLLGGGGEGTPAKVSRLQVVGLALCGELSARDMGEILKLLDTTCPGVREVDITGCSDQVILRALSVRALSTLGASPLHVHTRLMELAAGSARCNEVHPGIRCDGCGRFPIRGARWKCKMCSNFDLCNVCHTEFRATGKNHTIGPDPMYWFTCTICIHAHTQFNRIAKTPFAAFLDAIQEPMRLLFDPAFAPAEGAFLEEAEWQYDDEAGGELMAVRRRIRRRIQPEAGVLVEACVAGNEPAIVEAALLLGLAFAVDDADYEHKTRVFDCNRKDRNGQTALHFVAHQGCPAPLFAVLRSAGADVDATDNEWNTPLMIASKRGLCRVVELLLAEGADAAAKNMAGYTSVWLAMEQKHEATVEVLLEAIIAAGMDINARYEGNARDDEDDDDKEDDDDDKNVKRGQTLLMRASALGLTSTTAKLLALGADIGAKDAAGNTAVEWAKDAQTIEVLKAAGATMPEIPDEKKNAILLKYAAKGLTGGVLMALQAGAHVNQKGALSFTALHWAAFHGHHAVAQALLSANADINAKDYDSYTALHEAALYGRHAVVQALLSANADINAKGGWDSRTALHEAAVNGHHAVAQALLSANADINAKTSSGWTLLALARSGLLEEVLEDPRMSEHILTHKHKTHNIK